MNDTPLDHGRSVSVNKQVEEDGLIVALLAIVVVAVAIKEVLAQV